jgi:hypothetical protein
MGTVDFIVVSAHYGSSGAGFGSGLHGEHSLIAFLAPFAFGFRIRGVEMIVKTRTMRWPVFAVIPFALSRELRGIGGVLMKKWFIFLVCLWAFQASAQTTYPVASCSQIAVAAAIAAEQVHPVDGDIISIPSGTCTWTGTTPLSATFKNSVTIQGAGAVSATTGGATTTGSDLTVIIDNFNHTSGPSSVMQFGTTAGKSFRITGIAILINGSSTVANGGFFAIGGTSSSVRVDHCHFGLGSGTGLRLDGSVLGVADHNFFDTAPGNLNNDIAIHNGVGWNGTSASDNGDHSWADTDHFGTSSFFFVEDNLFSNGDVGDAHDAARFVIRHNTMTQSTAGNGQMFTHGTTNARGRATRAAEVYLNKFLQPGTGAGNPTYSLNSGTLLYWGNTVTQYKSAIQIDYTRKYNCPVVSYCFDLPPTDWGNCGTGTPNGPSNWDGNTNSSGYPCLDQPGRGAGDLLTGTFAAEGGVSPYTVNSTTGTVAWPHQVRSPVYIWNNNYTTGSGAALANNAAGVMQTDNVDYYQQFGANAEPGSNCTGSPCAITVGINQTSRAPVNGTDTCTAGPGGNTSGVGWWNTTNQTLYVCNPTNTWTVYYTPFTYPHPLTAGGTTGTGVNPPVNLAATVQ